MPIPIEQLATTIQAVRPMVPAKDFDLSLRFYADLGFQTEMLDTRLAEMTLGSCTFILQDYYVAAWADNFVIHMIVSDLDGWWEHIDALDLPGRYGVKTRSPELQPWGVRVAGSSTRLASCGGSTRLKREIWPNEAPLLRL